MTSPIRWVSLTTATLAWGSLIYFIVTDQIGLIGAGLLWVSGLLAFFLAVVRGR